MDKLDKIHKHFFFPIFFITLFVISLFTAMMVLLSLGNSQTLLQFAVLIAVTPILFILSNILYRYFDNFFVRILYIFSSYIGGLFLLWFFASIVLAVFYVLFLFVGPAYFFAVSILLYSLATLFFMIGILQAKKVKITRYEMPAPAKHESLKGKKFALVADMHLGPVNQEKFARRIFRKIINEKSDAVLFPGDMFDSECYGDVENIRKEIKVLTDAVPVFFSPGNHEQYGPFNHFIQIASDGGMTVLIDEKINFLGVPIFALNFRQTKRMDEIEKLINENISPENPAIVLNHEPVFHDLLSKAGAFLVVSGHTHNGQFWPGNYITDFFFYKKFTYGLQNYGGLSSITTSGIGTYGPAIRTFNTPEIVIINFV